MGGYCQARQRLPEGVLKRLARKTGRDLHEREMPAAWRRKGRAVKLADGTTVSMPDTPENQEAYPQSRRRRPGAGFPLARLVVLFSLAVGTALEAALGPWRGKQTGEIALARPSRVRRRTRSCRATASCARMPTSPCRASVTPMRSRGRTKAAAPTSAAAGAWGATTTRSAGESRRGGPPGWTRRPTGACPTG